jgi:hypothetical protein
MLPYSQALAYQNMQQEQLEKLKYHQSPANNHLPSKNNPI